MKHGLPLNRMITAHAGCENTSSNSAENVRCALETGCAALELDMRFSGGIVYLSHDARPHDMDCYTLGQALDEIADSDIKVNCDIKEDEALVPVIKKFAEYGMHNRMIMTGNFPRDFATDNGDIEFYLNLNYLIDENFIKYHPEEAAEKALELADIYGKQVNLKGYNMHYSCASRTLTDALHNNGLEISVWTPSDFESVADMIRMGADNVTTRTPVSAVSFLKDHLNPGNDFADEMFLRFEHDLMCADIANETRKYREKLQRQYATARVTKREYTVHGFYTHFEITDKSHTLGDGVYEFLGAVAADVNDLKNGTGYVLIIRDGLIACMEGYAYDEDFPRKIERYEIKPSNS
jgi:hypothetical protein